MQRISKKPFAGATKYIYPKKSEIKTVYANFNLLDRLEKSGKIRIALSVLLCLSLLITVVSFFVGSSGGYSEDGMDEYIVDQSDVLDNKAELLFYLKEITRGTGVRIRIAALPNQDASTIALTYKIDSDDIFVAVTYNTSTKIYSYDVLYNEDLGIASRAQILKEMLQKSSLDEDNFNNVFKTFAQSIVGQKEKSFTVSTQFIIFGVITILLTLGSLYLFQIFPSIKKYGEPAFIEVGETLDENYKEKKGKKMQGKLAHPPVASNMSGTNQFKQKKEKDVKTKEVSKPEQKPVESGVSFDDFVESQTKVIKEPDVKPETVVAEKTEVKPKKSEVKSDIDSHFLNLNIKKEQQQKNEASNVQEKIIEAPKESTIITEEIPAEPVEPVVKEVEPYIPTEVIEEKKEPEIKKEEAPNTIAMEDIFQEEEQQPVEDESKDLFSSSENEEPEEEKEEEDLFENSSHPFSRFFHAATVKEPEKKPEVKEEKTPDIKMAEPVIESPIVTEDKDESEDNPIQTKYVQPVTAPAEEKKPEVIPPKAEVKKISAADEQKKKLAALKQLKEIDMDLYRDALKEYMASLAETVTIEETTPENKEEARPQAPEVQPTRNAVPADNEAKKKDEQQVREAHKDKTTPIAPFFSFNKGKEVPSYQEVKEPQQEQKDKVRQFDDDFPENGYYIDDDDDDVVSWKDEKAQAEADDWDEICENRLKEEEERQKEEERQAELARQEELKKQAELSRLAEIKRKKELAEKAEAEKKEKERLAKGAEEKRKRIEEDRRRKEEENRRKLEERKALIDKQHEAKEVNNGTNNGMSFDDQFPDNGPTQPIINIPTAHYDPRTMELNRPKSTLRQDPEESLDGAHNAYNPQTSNKQQQKNDKLKVDKQLQDNQSALFDEIMSNYSSTKPDFSSFPSAFADTTPNVHTDYFPNPPQQAPIEKPQEYNYQKAFISVPETKEEEPTEEVKEPSEQKQDDSFTIQRTTVRSENADSQKEIEERRKEEGQKQSTLCNKCKQQVYYTKEMPEKCPYCGNIIKQKKGFFSGLLGK